jgi:hypothetical protein
MSAPMGAIEEGGTREDFLLTLPTQVNENNAEIHEFEKSG